jgi:serine phosphatase RsbU (regulator of sigma subunit)
VRRLVLPLTLTFVASLVLAPAVVAQDDQSLQVQDTPQEDVSEEFIEELLESPAQVEPVEEELQEAQQEAALEQQAGVREPAEVEDQKQIPQGGQQKQMPKQQQKQMPKTGGVELNALLLPAAALLVGTGIVAAYGIRRYRR